MVIFPKNMRVSALLYRDYNKFNILNNVFAIKLAAFCYFFISNCFIAQIVLYLYAVCSRFFRIIR